MSKILVDIESTFLDLEAGLDLPHSIYNPLKLSSRCDTDLYVEGINCDKEKHTFNGQSTNSCRNINYKESKYFDQN